MARITSIQRRCSCAVSLLAAGLRPRRPADGRSVVLGALTSRNPARKVLMLAELPRLGGAMDVPADRSPPTSSPPRHPTLREAARSPQRRRPTGAAPPLPYRLQTSGVGWLVAAVVLVGLTLAVFARGLRGPAVVVTVVDDAVVRWLAGLHGSELEPLLQSVARISSWWVLYALYFGLILALLVLRRWRHLIVWWVATNLAGIVAGLLARAAPRPRPFGVDIQASWGGWALPSQPVFG